eukprot:CAMPEP_0119304208 /NCGR_PEP_ID=MMETSP1333-20130426/5493_1 /TAXON_ID=418940 /ORGANISM="Scyphosphaera apsteinii, Strain RCC1455" /LENGTH=222 /DNA_ID=CAMNT_0007307059 /DNA_START=122 /DNA_END=790 /DNA_ORIENTATION=+
MTTILWLVISAPQADQSALTSSAPQADQFAALIDQQAALTSSISCHAKDAYDLSGDAAYVWGLAFHVENAAACCSACAAHASTCSKKKSRGKIFWERPRQRCSGKRNACNAFVFCAGTPSQQGAEDRCFSYDIHNHTRGECWLKHESEPTRPIAAGPVLPDAMRFAPRRDWPWAVSQKVWPWPVPKRISWQSAISPQKVFEKQTNREVESPVARVLAHPSGS